MEKHKTISSHRSGLISPTTRENLRVYAYKFSRNKLSMIGLLLVLISVFIGIFCLRLAPHPESIGAYVNFAEANLPPSSEYWFGTDVYGRDVFSRVLYCFRGTLIMTVVVLGIAIPVGTFLGLLAGYYHNTWIDTLIMRLTDVFLAMPALILAMSIASILKPGLMGAMVALTVSWWTWYCRIAYGNATQVSKEYFVKEAELIGASKTHIFFREILPNIYSPIFTKAALDVAYVIINASALSFCGLGEQPPTPAFGTMIADGYKYLPDLWWTTVFPALGIAFVILGFNFFGDGIRDMLDKGRQ